MQIKAGIIIAIIALPFFMGCGIEDYPYINPVPQANVTQEMNNRAIVRLPNNYEGTTFTNFAVYYRIYVSDISLTNPMPGQDFKDINTALNNHYNAVSSFIDGDKPFSATMVDTYFIDKGYKYLRFREKDIDDVLTSAVFNRTLSFDFTYSNRPPKMAVFNGSIKEAEYTLLRSDELKQPLPDNRLFLHSEDLYYSGNIKPEINADVEGNSDMGATTGRFTYAAMFIIAVGFNSNDLAMIYSTPSLIHAFPLPNE